MTNLQHTSVSSDRHSRAAASHYAELKAHARAGSARFVWREIKDKEGNVVEVIAFTEHPEGIKELIEFLEEDDKDCETEVALD